MAVKESSRIEKKWNIPKAIPQLDMAFAWSLVQNIKV